MCSSLGRLPMWYGPFGIQPTGRSTTVFHMRKIIDMNHIILSISYCPDHIVLVVIIASIYHIYIFLFIYRLNSGIFRIFAHIYETFHMIWTISYIHIMVHMLWTNRFSWRKRDTEDRLSKPYSSPDMIKWTWRGHFLQSTIWLKYLTSL